MRGIKTIESSSRYSGEVSLRIDRFVLAGKQIKKEIVVHRDSVGILPIEQRSGGLVVTLVSQYRRAADAMLLEIPAGKIEPGETPRQAAVRELAEEVGCKPSILRPLLRCYLAPGYDTEFMTIFVARSLGKVPRGQLDEDENISIKRLSFKSALRMCMSGEIIDCKTIAALFAFAKTIR
ncbi:MAG: NUDIX hydrolase [Nitrososphaera sp.]|jgi:ADP-ribose pyrophosphatase